MLSLPSGILCGNTSPYDQVLQNDSLPQPLLSNINNDPLWSWNQIPFLIQWRNNYSGGDMLSQCLLEVRLIYCNISLSLNFVCPQRNGKEGCNWRKGSDSHFASSSSRFFHLIKYSLIIREHNLFSPVTIMASGSKIILPSSPNTGSIVCVF